MIMCRNINKIPGFKRRVFTFPSGHPFQDYYVLVEAEDIETVFTVMDVFFSEFLSSVATPNYSPAKFLEMQINGKIDESDECIIFVQSINGVTSHTTLTRIDLEEYIL